MTLRALNERRAAAAGEPPPVRLDYATVFHHAQRKRRAQWQVARTEGG